jgi:hypothetical protein
MSMSSIHAINRHYLLLTPSIRANEEASKCYRAVKRHSQVGQLRQRGPSEIKTKSLIHRTWILSAEFTVRALRYHRLRNAALRR